MTDKGATPVARSPRRPVDAAEPLVLHRRGGVVIVILLLLTLGLMLPLVMHSAGVPLG